MGGLRTVIFMALLGLGLAAPAAAATKPSSLQAKLDSYVRARADLGHFGGSVLIAHKGVVLLSKGYGSASRELGVPNGPQTRFLTASITKQFTTAAILKLRDAGKLTLEDRLCTWIERCPDGWRGITLRHVLAHQSGIWDYESALGMGSPDYAAEMARSDHVARLLDRARTQPLQSEPGKAFHYSNSGYLFLAKVVEKASGRSYKNYLETELLKPAGMTSSGIADGSPVRHLASGYRLNDDLSRKQLLKGMAIDRIPLMAQSAGLLTNDHGDAALYANAMDLYRWVLALDSGKLLKPSSVAEMRSKSSDGQGLGLGILQRFDRTAYVNDGILSGYVSRLEYYPQEKLAIILLSNLENSRLSKMARDLSAAVLQRPYDVPRSYDLDSLTSDGRKEYLGAFLMGDRPVTIKQSDEMLVLSGASFNAGMLPIGKDKFFLPLFEGSLSFRRSKEGRLSDAILHYEGVDHPIRAKT